MPTKNWRATSHRALIFPPQTSAIDMAATYPTSAVPAASQRIAYRLVIPATVLVFYAALAALWHWGLHSAYFTILRLFGFEPFRFPFLDIHAVLAAVQCHHLGIDVYFVNPCDALGRPHVYSPLWLRVVPGFLDYRLDNHLRNYARSSFHHVVGGLVPASVAA